VADTTEHNTVKRYNSTLLFLEVSGSFTCAVGAGEGLFSRLVSNGEVGVGATGFISGGASVVSSPITCKNYQMEWNPTNNK
jgi:hypothetical protein